MTHLIDRIKGYFTQRPLPHSAFQISFRYLSGIRVSPREGNIKNHFVLPIERGVIQPSFSKKNIKNPVILEQKLSEGLEKLHLTGHKIACLIPEASIRAFVFSFDSLPSSRQEREQIIHFRVKKQMPFLPDDTRFSLKVMKANSQEKVIAAIARASVVQEYEDLFNKLRLKVRVVGGPTLSLYNLIDRGKEKDSLLINVEEDSLSLVAIVNSEIALYRQKPFIHDPQTDISGIHRVDNIAKEVENTLNFIEDKEKKKIHSIWVRLGLLETEEDIFSHLKEKLSSPPVGIEVCLGTELGLKERKILSPLIGQIL